METQGLWKKWWQGSSVAMSSLMYSLQQMGQHCSCPIAARAKQGPRSHWLHLNRPKHARYPKTHGDRAADLTGLAAKPRFWLVPWQVGICKLLLRYKSWLVNSHLNRPFDKLTAFFSRGKVCPHVVFMEHLIKVPNSPALHVFHVGVHFKQAVW